MMTRILISGSLALGGATFVAAQDSTLELEQDNGRIPGEVQIHTGDDAAQQAGDRQQSQQNRQSRDMTGMQSQHGQKMKAEDVLKEMASANQLEVKLGELAQERAQDPQVQQFARQMVQHHHEALEQVKQTAEQKNVDIAEDELAEHHQAIFDKLQEKQGEQFEAAYMFHQAGKHVQDILAAQHVATTADDQELQTLARQQLPILEQHLQQATDIAQNIATQGQAVPAGATLQDDQDRGLQQRDSMQPGQRNGLQQQDGLQRDQQDQGWQQRDSSQPGQRSQPGQTGQSGQGFGTGTQDRSDQGTSPGSSDRSQSPNAGGSTVGQ